MAKWHDRSHWLERTFSKVVAVPVLAFVGAALCDWAYASSMTLQWSNFSGWLLLMGLVGGMTALLILALVVRTRGDGWLGLGLLGIGLAVEIANFMAHMRDGYIAVMPLGLTLSVIGALVVIVAAWLTAYPVSGARA